MGPHEHAHILRKIGDSFYRRPVLFLRRRCGLQLDLASLPGNTVHANKNQRMSQRISPLRDN